MKREGIATEAPWRAGLHSARATLGPGSVLIAAAATLVAVYYRVPQMRPAFDALSAFRTRGGFGFSSASMLLGHPVLAPHRAPEPRDLNAPRSGPACPD